MKDQWIDWLQDRQRHFFYGIGIIIAVFFIAFQAAGKIHKQGTSSYLAANQAFENWMLKGEAFNKLESILKKHPELETKFGALIADKFIAQNEEDKAKEFADKIFARVLKQTPGHVAFAESSLLIAKNNFRDALIQSIALKESINENSLLYGFNLVRIASLYRILNAHEQEVATLQDLEQYMRSNENAATILTESYKEGNITLADYIIERTR